MIRSRSIAALALALTLPLGAAACGDGGGGGVNTDGQSVILVHLIIDNNVPALYQVQVNAHLANGGIDNSLYFPMSPRMQPIPSGATLALLIPTTRDGPVDLTLYGLDTDSHAVANGKGHVVLQVGGDQVEVTVPLSLCATVGCN
jgi:hypothetical protein